MLRAPTIKTAFGIRRARMRIVLALLAMEIRAVIPVVAVLAAKAFLRCPGLDQRTVYREVLIRQERFHLGVVQKPGHELRKNVTILESIAIFRKRRRIPYRVVGR